MTEDQIKYMVNRFLGWKLPESFNPDCGISFKKAHSENGPFGPQRYEPVGTNLFDYTQVDAMVRYMLEGAPSTESEGAKLDFLAHTAKTSRTGVSIDFVPSVDGEPSGFRVLSHHSVGEPRKTITGAIDDAMKRHGFVQ